MSYGAVIMPSRSSTAQHRNGAAFWLYFSGDFATFIYLAFFSGWGTGMDHIWLIPVHLAIAQVWPLYWGIHWLI